MVQDIIRYIKTHEKNHDRKTIIETLLQQGVDKDKIMAVYKTINNKDDINYSGGENKKNHKKNRKNEDLGYDKTAKLHRINSKQRLYNMYFSNKAYMITVWHRNFTHTDYTVKAEDYDRVRIKYAKNKYHTYLICQEAGNYNNTTKMWHLNYLEGFALPFKIELLQTKLLTHNGNKMFTISVPDEKGKIIEKTISLREWLESENVFYGAYADIMTDVSKGDHVKASMHGKELTEQIKKLASYVTYIGIGMAISVAIQVWKSGLLK